MIKAKEPTMRFPIVLHTDDGARFGVTVPDLPGCFSAGDSFDEAVESAKEAIALHLEGMTEDGEAIPAARSIAEHRVNPDYDDGVWAVVEVEATALAGHPERIDVTMPGALLREIDRYTQTHGETRSGFLARAARQALGESR
jgi:predicted RNase H-like HicB family nuclease